MTWYKSMDGLNDSKDTAEVTTKTEQHSPHKKWLVAAGVFFLILFSAMFLSYRILSMAPQTSAISTGLSTQGSVDLSTAEPTRAPINTPTEVSIKDVSNEQAQLNATKSQNKSNQESHISSDASRNSILINYNDFKQEAQRLVLREEEAIQAGNGDAHTQITMSAEEFRSEAENNLYRDADKD